MRYATLTLAFFVLLIPAALAFVIARYRGWRTRLLLVVGWPLLVLIGYALAQWMSQSPASGGEGGWDPGAWNAVLAVWFLVTFELGALAGIAIGTVRQRRSRRYTSASNAELQGLAARREGRDRGGRRDRSA